ncbi:MAG: nitroreductase family protein [Candidatus Scatosoma sp.]
MEYSELVKRRYACRNFSSRAVEKELLYKIVSEAMNAPSAKNTQPWKFYVSCEEETNGKIRSCLQDNGKNGFLSSAPAFIAIFEEMPDNIACEKYGNDRFVKYDVGQVAAYLTLSAKNEGLDSCVIGWINEKRLREVTGVNKPCGIVIAFGYAEEGSATPVKKRALREEKIIGYTEKDTDD